MIARFVVSCMLAVAVTTTAAAQGGATDNTHSPSDNSAKNEVDKRPMKSVPPENGNAEAIATLDDLVQRIDQQFAMITKRMQLGFNAYKDLQSDVDDVAEAQSELRTEFEQLKTQLDTVQEALHTKIAEQQQLLDAVVSDDLDGNAYLRLDSSMENPDFRKQMSKAVHESIQDDGEFVVTNKMDGIQWIIVNGQQVVIEPQKQKTLKVPVGTVTTQLPGQILQNWTIGAPSYRQAIDIVSQQNLAQQQNPQTTTFRPSSSSGIDSSQTPITTVFSIPTTGYTTYYGPTYAYDPNAHWPWQSNGPWGRLLRTR